MMSGNVHAAGITNYVAYRKRPWPVIRIHSEMMGDRQMKAAWQRLSIYKALRMTS
jgi:hypothetical protein